jgi:hypothetical protein
MIYNSRSCLVIYQAVNLLHYLYMFSFCAVYSENGSKDNLIIFHVFQMFGATRETPEGFTPDQASGSQQPPPPPPNLAEVMARQTELLNLIVQAQQNQHCPQP